MKTEKKRSLKQILYLISLLLFSNLLWSQTQSTSTTISDSKKAFFNVLDYGTQRDGTEDASKGINAAIQAAKAVGGGIVYIPAGNYTCGPIELVSNLELYIEAGATLKFLAQNLPFTKGRNQSIECLTAIPLIGGHDLENVTIKGGGTITTSNAEW